MPPTDAELPETQREAIRLRVEDDLDCERAGAARGASPSRSPRRR
jgi:hypothetical protein